MSSKKQIDIDTEIVIEKMQRQFLNEEVLILAFSYLKLTSLHRLSQASKHFRYIANLMMKNIDVLECRHIDLVPPCRSNIKSSILMCSSIRAIDFTESTLVDKEVIRTLVRACNQCRRSNLNTLILDKCQRVSDEEVCYMIKNFTASLIKRISVIGCETGMRSILSAREKKIVLNRIPGWEVGHWHCIDHEDKRMIGEIHTYFPDGTFDFSREQQSSGYVRMGVSNDFPS